MEIVKLKCLYVYQFIYVNIPSNLMHTRVHIHGVYVAVFVHHGNGEIGQQLIEPHQKALAATVVHARNDLQGVVFPDKLCRRLRRVAAENDGHVHQRI